MTSMRKFIAKQLWNKISSVVLRVLTAKSGFWRSIVRRSTQSFAVFVQLNGPVRSGQNGWIDALRHSRNDALLHCNCDISIDKRIFNEPRFAVFTSFEVSPYFPIVLHCSLGTGSTFSLSHSWSTSAFLPGTFFGVCSNGGAFICITGTKGLGGARERACDVAEKCGVWSDSRRKSSYLQNDSYFLYQVSPIIQVLARVSTLIVILLSRWFEKSFRGQH